MKRLMVLAILVSVLVVPAVFRGSAAGFEDAEFHLGINPTLCMREAGASFDLWALGWTDATGEPLLLFEFSLNFIDRIGVTLTSAVSTDEPIVFFGKPISVYVSLGMERYESDVHDWFGEIGLILSVTNSLYMQIGYGSPSWLNVGFGLTASLLDILDFISAYADRPLG